MNILVLGKFYTEGFALHIAETLRDMGHNVRRFEPGYKSGRIGGRIGVGHRIDQVQGLIHSTTDNLPSIRARRIRALWKAVDEAPLDIVLTCHDFLWPDEVAELKRRTGAIVVMWFPDHLANFGKGFFMNAPYDGLFFKDPYIVHALSDTLHSPVYYLPECFNPHRHRLPPGESPGAEYRCDITTAGNQHSWRVAFFKHLAGYDVKLWGQPAPLWLPTDAIRVMYQGRGVLNEDKARAFLGAKIVLNNLHYGEIWGLNVRAFEAAGIGAFQMVDWRPGLCQLFEDGKELVSFRGMGNLKNKIDYWLDRPDDRSEIAAAGKRRAHAEHTYKLRLELLLDTLAGRAKGFPLPDLNHSH
jgi:spore maturation protein CgeB